MAPRKQKSLVQTPEEMLRGYYRDMMLIRRFEEKAGQLYGMGLIGGFCHLSIGQEAVVVGLESLAKPDDRRIASYRCHGLMLALGMEPERIMAELTGRASGYSRGKGGSMHMYSPENGFYGGHGIVGAQVPIGAGLAFADRYRGTDQVTFCYFGDGAADQGQVHESYVMAARWKLPIVFVIENNQLENARSVRAQAAPQLFERGKPLGIPGESVDGMDVMAVRDAGARAVTRARAGKGPTILEMRTVRYRGHSMSDPARYRTREEMARIRDERDAISLVRSQLLDGGIATEDDLKATDRDIKDIVSRAAAFARDSAEPPLEALMTDIYPEAS